MHRLLPVPDHRGWIAVVAAAALLSCATAFAQEAKQAAPNAGPTPTIEPAKAAPVTPATAGSTAPQALAPAPAAQARPLSPMMIDIQAVLAAESEQLAELGQRVKAATTPDEALELQRRIERVKFDTEVSLLRVQAKHARQAGRTVVAARIEAAITDLLNPPKLGAPAARPVPTREDPSR